MQIFSVQEAKNNLSALLAAVEEGEEIVITRHGKRIARIVHETEANPTEAERSRKRSQALDALRAYQSQVKPDPDYKPGDWKTYRDEGRK